ncbi:glutaminase GtaA [Aspergillus steynii IBT 23096]|uniref:Glutaminase GtaA n=1 Tax=Aspergillus steynii IBT 23096 TaxID=1392250 RepID=A0A2I2GHT5_9EURO|nr:glutaminase GtaA [Aspergillus steynii IBT 23096]PLB52445.1 glutaminase GtaA [Aspergillus steynii IBT 23096]
MILSLLCIPAAFLASVTEAVSVFTPARPPALPLAVKSPYLSTWLPAGKDGGNGGYLAGEWPTFWEGQINGWAGMIRVDGNVYTWMGLPGTTTVNQTAYEYTSTKSIFTLHVGNLVEMNVTFLSPITPDDLRRQSLIFSYLDIDVASLDGKDHDVQLYTDISAEWVSGDRKAIVEWDHGVTKDGVSYHKINRQTQLLFSEVKDQAEWGEWYWATDSGDGLTYQSGGGSAVRDAFTKNGKLDNSKDSNYRAISDNWPVFGFARNLGSVKAGGALFTIGLAQRDAIQYSGSSDGTIAEPSLWTSYFSDGPAALDFFHHDYAESSSLSSDLDKRIAKDSLAAAGQDYLTITSLSARQAFAATQLCGTPDNTYLFMKEISSNGNMNTVDVIFPAHPVFLYTNPQLLKFLMKPLYEIQERGKYPNRYAMHDIGSHYPNATGHPDGNDEPMPLEECGNMVIMALAYALKAKDMDYLDLHYKHLKQWTAYLVEDAIYPANQISTDDFAGPLANQTNLALKGIIGIQAMASIGNLTEDFDVATNHSRIAHDYIERWQTLGIAHNADPPHTTLSYGSNQSHGLLYNLYADRELGLNLVPQSVYDMQSKFYPTVQNTYGVPLDTRHEYTKGDWELFTAAIASKDTRDMFIRRLAKWIDETPTNRALTDLYDTKSGDYPQITFIARPVMGGAFSLILLDQGL